MRLALSVSSRVAWNVLCLVSCPDFYSPIAEERPGDNRTCCPTFEWRDQSDVGQ